MTAIDRPRRRVATRVTRVEPTENDHSTDWANALDAQLVGFGRVILPSEKTEFQIGPSQTWPFEATSRRVPGPP
jgi:hypothetical protein